MKKILAFLLVASVFNHVQGGWLDFLGINKSATNNNASNSATIAGLSNDQVTGALKDALGNGLRYAIAVLGHEDGFLTNAEVKIPLPDKLQLVEKGLKAVHEEKYADEFVATLNHAAEQAVPQAAGVFAEAVRQMSFDDAKAILTGPQDAATQYFRQTTQTNLYNLFYPIVQQATATNGVTSAYKKMMAKVNSGGSGFEGKLEGMADKYLGSDAIDLDAYVTDKALDGLFAKVADEEKHIRQDSTARTTDLMKQVFGAAQSR